MSLVINNRKDAGALHKDFNLSLVQFKELIACLRLVIKEYISF